MRLQGLLRPRSIAIVGASPNSFVGQVAVKNCQLLEFGGALTPVNGRHELVAGVPTAASVSSMESVPDLVVVQVATPRVLGLVEEALAAGVRNFVIPGGGFTDSGEEATALAEGLKTLRRAYDFDVVGPNCMGVVDMVTGAAPYVGTVPPEIRRGTVGVIAQSGAVVELVVNSGGRVPVSTLVSSGSESTTGLAEYLDFFREDPETTAVIAFIEGFNDPDAFLAAARRFVSAGKHLAATVVGRSEVSREGVSAHSGKLAPSARVTMAVLRQLGVHLADDLDELLAFGEILGCGNLPTGNRVYFVTNSGGEGNLLADLAEDAGLVLPAMSAQAITELTEKWPLFTVRNPLDPWGVDDYHVVYPRAIGIASQERGDILVVSQDQQQTSGAHERDLGLHLAQYLASERRDGVVPVLLSPTSQDPDARITEFCRDHAIAHLRGARTALSVLGKLVAPEAVNGALPELDPVPGDRLTDPRALTEDEALELLSSLGVGVPKQVRVADPDAAVVAAAGLDGPAVIKGVAEKLWHKSELGLVAVGMHGAEKVREAATSILKNGERAGLNLDLIVAEMATGSLDVYVGYKRDAQFGHTVVVGLGGIWTEHLDQVDIYVGLLDEDLARRWLESTRVGQMMATARGATMPAAPVVDALVAVSRIAKHDQTVIGIDINPILMSNFGGTAVDAVIQRTTDNATTKEHQHV